MQNSQFKRGYDFQHLVKEYFLELGFDTQEEQWKTRTDVVLSHAPINIAVECKHYLGGVTPELVDEFDKRLKEWQQLGRPCLGVMVALSFQNAAKERCDQKNILYLTTDLLENALAQKRGAGELSSIKTTKSVAELIVTLAGLSRDWLNLVYHDPVFDDIPFWANIVAKQYVEQVIQMQPKFYSYEISAKGKSLFLGFHKLYKLLLGSQSKENMSEVQISKSIKSVLTDLDETLLQSNDLLVLTGLGLLIFYEGHYVVSDFGKALLDIVQ